MGTAEVGEKILAIVARRGSASGAAIAAALGMTRQAAHAHLVRLVDRGRLARVGRTRGTLYLLPGKSRAPTREESSYSRTFSLEGLQEDAVLRDVTLHLGLQAALSGPARAIYNYAFTEMLNNAIEHSHAATCTVRAALAAREITTVIRDQGIGLYASIASRMGLRDENDAIGELLKGKATTMPQHHSGEGIFFTSKACDALALRSHRIELEFAARPARVAVLIRKPLRGTEVRIRLSRSARRKLSEVFAAYAPEEYDFRFERSVVTVRFAAREYVSRSEARRLLARLETFREVVLDFRGVRALGQAFADEVFRVFPASHRQVRLSWVNVEPALEAMIRHVVDNPAQGAG